MSSYRHSQEFNVHTDNKFRCHTLSYIIVSYHVYTAVEASPSFHPDPAFPVIHITKPLCRYLATKTGATTRVLFDDGVVVSFLC